MQKLLAVLVVISIVLSGVTLAYVVVLNSNLQNQILSQLTTLSEAESGMLHEMSDLGRALNVSLDRINLLQDMVDNYSKPKEYIKIGVICPLTGPWAEFGAYLRDDCILAAEEVNAQGGVLGRQIQLFFGDDEGKPELGVAAAERLFDLNGIDFLIGGWATSVSVAVMDVVASRGKIFLNSNSLGETITAKFLSDPQKYWMVFKLLPGTELYSVCAVEFIDYLEKTGLYVPATKVCAAVVEDTDWGRTAIVHAQNLTKQYGWDMKVLEIVRADLTDYYPILGKIKDANASLVLAMVGTVPACVALNKQFRELNVQAMFVPYVAATDAKYRQLAGDAADGVTWISFPSYLPGVYAAATTLENKFMTRFGKINTGGGADAYCGLMVLLQAIGRAGSLDQRAVAAEILNTNWTGPMGANAFDPVTHTGLAGEKYMFPTMNQIWSDYGLNSTYPKGYPIYPSKVAFKQFQLPPWFAQ